MKPVNGLKTALYFIFFGLTLITTPSFAKNKTNSAPAINAIITSQIFDEVKKNDNWKIAFLTGKHAQIVFMNISPTTNPKNEIGMEVHKFDQIIYIVEGNAKAILDKKNANVKEGDAIFIPQGTRHNVINLSVNAPLKIMSIYSDRDIPANSVYKKKSDAPQD